MGLTTGVSFSRREFRNREAVGSFEGWECFDYVSVGANSGIVRRPFELQVRGKGVQFQSARIQES